MRALISVSDKTRLDVFAKKLQDMNIEIYSTEGTANFLERRGIKVKRLSEITKIKESNNLKTLHPEVFRKIFEGFFDLIVVNLYEDEIDVGGVALIRAGVKANALVVCRIDDYDLVLNAIKSGEDVKKQLHLRALEYLLENDRKIFEKLRD